MRSRNLLHVGSALGIAALTLTASALAHPGIVGKMPIERVLVVSLSDEERAELERLLMDPPSIDLEIRFAADSANIEQDSLPALNSLGQALSSMKGSTFVIAGTTDAIDDSGKQSLAVLRAEAVKQYLVAKYEIDPADLVTTAVASKSGNTCCVRILNVSVKPIKDKSN
jgi:outer membrane protein OmpA-like peptidoglycan-associated protein